MQVVDDQGNPISNQESKRILAGILAIILGSLGVHKFVLGYTKEGLIMLFITILASRFLGFGAGVMALIGLIEGIIYLTKSDHDFINEYQINKKPWF